MSDKSKAKAIQIIILDDESEVINIGECNIDDTEFGIWLAHMVAEFTELSHQDEDI